MEKTEKVIHEDLKYNDRFEKSLKL